MVRRIAFREKSRAGFGAGLDLMSVDGDDQVGSRREGPVDRADADAGPGRDVAHRHVDARLDKRRGGRVEQCRLVPPGIGPLPRPSRPRFTLTGGHARATSVAYLAKRNIVPYRLYRNPGPLPSR